MGTGIARPSPKDGGSGRAFLLATGMFAGSLAFFFWSQFYMHKRDDQTWIVRHGQQPGPSGAPMRGPRFVATHVDTNRHIPPGSFPLPSNDDNRGSEGALARVMSFVAGKGLHPDPHVPEKPLNKTQPAPQRVNAAGTHNYTKRIV